MRRVFIGGAVICAALALAGWGVTRPALLPADALATVTGDATRGARIFALSGCASCHAAPGLSANDPGGSASAAPVLAGGQKLVSGFGTFVSPNISTDATYGLGAWSQQDFANAVLRGVSPSGQHYYPAFPYAAYSRMTPADLVDLWAYMQTLPASDTPSIPHEIGFPVTLRRAVGLWKALYMPATSPTDWVIDTTDPQIQQGRYIVEALAHCAECHTPRTALGGLQTSAWMTGAPNPSGRGSIPPLTPDALSWHPDDIAYYLETGFTPDFDSAGGSMAKVVARFAKASPADRAAVAAYIAALPN
ncbi:MAG: c-type cytochrome [Primorskyibacter sp.]